MLMHRWRKRVKDLRYAAEALSRCEPERGLAASASAGLRKGSRKQARRKQARRKQARDLRRLARRADRLAERLGQEHDLVVLESLVRNDQACGRATRKAVLKAIRRRRQRLVSRTLRDGARLFRRRPKRFVADVAAGYAREAAPTG
jgi:CHAD domain-containing protein